MDNDSGTMADGTPANPGDEVPDGGTLVGVHAGFPNPSADRHGSSLSLDRLLIKHPSSTYFFRIRGHTWEEQGIFDGDIAIIDRALAPQTGDTVVWWDENGEFYLTAHQRAHQQNIWGVVSNIVHSYRQDQS